MQLKDAMQKIKQLNGIVPVCSLCKNIWDDDCFLRKKVNS